MRKTQDTNRKEIKGLLIGLLGLINRHNLHKIDTNSVGLTLFLATFHKMRQKGKNCG